MVALYEKDGLLHIQDGDIIGSFLDDRYEASSLLTTHEYASDNNGAISGRISNTLVVGTIPDRGAMQTQDVLVEGSGKIVLKGKQGNHFYAGLIADEVTVNGDDGETNIDVAMAKFRTLTITGGTVKLRTDTGASQGNSTIQDPSSYKQAQVTEKIEVSAGSLTMGGNCTSGSDTEHYINAIAGDLIQSGGTIAIKGKTYVSSSLTINQSGGEMSIADGYRLRVSSSGTRLCIMQSGAASIMNIGRIIPYNINTTLSWMASSHKNAAVSVEQTGSGTINLKDGVTFLSAENSTITQTGGGKINLSGNFTSAKFDVEQTMGTLAVGVITPEKTTTAKLAGDTASIDGQLNITAGSEYSVKESFKVGANAAIDVDGKLVIGGDVSGVNDGGMALKGGKLEFLATDDTTAAITLNSGALTMSSGAAVELNFTDAFLGAMTDSDSDGDYEFKALLASGASSASADLGITLTTSCLTWNLATGSTVALEKDATGNVYLTGELTKNTDTTITVDGQEEVINKVEGVRTLVIKTDTTISSDNTHTGGTEVHGANVVLNNAGALGDGDDVSTEGVSSLQTSEGIVAELHAAIRNSGDLTLGGDYSAESGKLTSLGGSGETYICTKGEEGKNGFASRGDRLVFVESSASNASLNVESCTTLTVGTDKYIVSDEGNAWQLDTDTYYIREEGHQVAMSEIHDVRDALGTSTTPPKVDMVAGELTVDEGVASVSASGGDILMKGDVTVTGELSGDTTVAVLEGEATLNGDNSHTGGTYIANGATLKLGSADALGAGAVELRTGGILDLAGYAVSNYINVTGCTLCGADAYTGNVDVSGSLNLDGNATANKVTMVNGGTITPLANETLTVNTIEVVGADSTVGADLTVNPNGRIILNNGVILNLTGSLTLGNGATIVLHGQNYTTGSTLMTVNGDMNRTTGSVTLDYGFGTYALVGNEVKLMAIFDQNIADAMVQANWGMITGSRAFVHAVRGQRTNTGCIADGRGTAWAAVLGAYNDLDGGDINLKGAAVGADMKVGSRSSVGMAIGYLDGEVSPTGLSEVDQEGTYVALYGEHGLRKLSATSCLSADWVVAYGQTESKYKGMSWDQDSLQLNGRLSWNKQLSERLGLRVFGGLEYFTSDSDTVNGIKTGSIDNLRGELGVGVDYVAWGMPVDEKSAGMGCKRLVLHGELRYFNDLDRENPVVEMDGLSGRGENPGRSGVGIDVGATYRINDRWSTSANYSYSTMDGSTEHRLNVGASYTF